MHSKSYGFWKSPTGAIKFKEKLVSQEDEHTVSSLGGSTFFSLTTLCRILNSCVTFLIEFSDDVKFAWKIASEGKFK